MLTPDVTYRTYLAEIDRYLRDSRAFAEELKGLEREKLRESAEVSRSFEQELRCLELRVHDAEKSYEKTARMLNSGEPPMPTRKAKEEIRVTAGPHTPAPARAKLPISGIFPI